MKKHILLFALMCIALLPACKKSAQDNNTSPIVTGASGIKVPAGFNWESSHYVNFTVSVTDARFGTALHSIAIYDGDPYNGGHLIAKGSASTSTAYTNNVYLSNQLTSVYVVKTSPDNSRIIHQVSVVGTTASLSFEDKDPDALLRMSNKEGNKLTSGTDCSSGCTNTITTNTSNVNVNNGDVICVTGNNITVGFSSVNGGMVRVCGANVTLQNLSMNGTFTLLVSASGSALISGLNYNSSTASVINYGTITYSGTFPDNGIFTNNGTFNCSGDFNLNSGSGAFTNNSSMTVTGSYNSGSSVTATNNGTMLVNNNFQQNGGTAAFINNCSLIVNNNYNQSGPVKNYNLIKVGGTSTINSSTELGLYNTAMLETNNFILDGSVIKGYGSTSLVKITGAVTIRNSGAVITANVQVCSTNPVGATYLTGGAATGCSLYIPVTTCNGDGNGTATVIDTDGDGVPDNLDDYPTDPTKAYNNYYPSSTGGATVAFEDLWPAKGDFDLNDVVVAYNYKIVTNASNAVVQVTGNYTLQATGGTQGNGFGVQFPVSRSSVSGAVTGGTLEAGQTNAVVLVFTNMRSEMANWNTQPGVAQSPVNNYTVTFNVTGGPSISTFGLNGYNPFIWNYGTGTTSRRETHLSGHAPTDLADQTLFGTKDDSTVAAAGRYYVTKTGLPYAIDVPVNPYSYVIEGTDITQAYLHFAAWAQSGGTTFTDWYSNTASGYRNTALIYTR